MYNAVQSVIIFQKKKRKILKTNLLQFCVSCLIFSYCLTRCVCECSAETMGTFYSFCVRANSGRDTMISELVLSFLRNIVVINLLKYVWWCLCFINLVGIIMNKSIKGSCICIFVGTRELSE